MPNTQSEFEWIIINDDESIDSTTAFAISILQWFYSFFFRVFLCGKIELKGNGIIISNKMVMFLFTFRVCIVFVFCFMIRINSIVIFVMQQIWDDQERDSCAHFFLFKWIELTLIDESIRNESKFQFFVLTYFCLIHLRSQPMIILRLQRFTIHGNALQTICIHVSENTNK